jgi:hypothetical protein
MNHSQSPLISDFLGSPSPVDTLQAILSNSGNGEPWQEPAQPYAILAPSPATPGFILGE